MLARKSDVRDVFFSGGNIGYLYNPPPEKPQEQEEEPKVEEKKIDGPRRSEMNVTQKCEYIGKHGKDAYLDLPW